MEGDSIQEADRRIDDHATSGSLLQDDDLVDQGALLADLLRGAAKRWRFRLGADRLGGHPLAEAVQLTEALEASAALLEERLRLAGGDDSRAGKHDEPAAVLSASEERFRLLAGSAKDYAIVMLDSEGRVVNWDDAAQRLKGYKEEEILGQHFSLFYTEEDRQRAHPQHDLESAKANGSYKEEGWRVRKDGSRFWANVVITALYDERGGLRGFGEVTGDFTERREAEEALRQSEERFRLLVESVKDYAIFMLDPNGYVSSWNSGASRMKGYSAEEIVGQHFSVFFTEEDRALRKPEQELDLAAQRGIARGGGWRVRKDGSRFWADVTVSAMRRPDGSLLGFAKVTRDLTERRGADAAVSVINQELQQRVVERTREAENINRELEAFSYSIAHDLRAPLRSIDGFSHALLEDYADKLDAEGRTYLAYVRESAQQMAQLIDDLLALARLTQSELRLEAVDLTAVARDVLERLQKGEPGRKAELAVADGLVANGDARLLGVVIENLIGNAWKFTRKRPVTRIEFGAGLQDGRRVYVVRDNGVGFDMAYVDKLFGPFQRLHSASEFEGTGIGLATVQRIVRLHGGRIWAEGEVGRGATFYFTLGEDS